MTRSEILDAAAALFAERGYDGVSMRDIAAASGSSQPLLHFHFGSKRDLYDAVRERMQEQYTESLDGGLDEDSPDEEFFVGPLVSRMRHTFANPERARLMVWELLEEVDREPRSLGQLRKQVSKRIEKAREAGVLHSDVRVPMLTAILAGAVLLWPLLRKRYSEMLPRGERKDADEWYIDELLRLLVSGIGGKTFADMMSSWVERNGRGT
jgi:TetR/AcrR family transcriptional regulator